MFFFFALAAAGVLLGAAAHTTMPQFLLAGAVIGLWLLAFGVREGVGRLRHR